MSTNIDAAFFYLDWDRDNRNVDEVECTAYNLESAERCQCSTCRLERDNRAYEQRQVQANQETLERLRGHISKYPEIYGITPPKPLPAFYFQ